MLARSDDSSCINQVQEFYSLAAATKWLSERIFLNADRAIYRASIRLVREKNRSNSLCSFKIISLALPFAMQSLTAYCCLLRKADYWYELSPRFPRSP